ncbi:polysaccharide deacetylase [Falsochrobactrum shanghaiense]|uniref:Chitooligosaccharide deacetylase n=1 Tax=Falsochrobactrum shanghaiense TaxID=2201899 RepID=A0A316JB17_9HYPH|nr:allantoinase PuuE [Falsochrobactrum shanghaiense]PWL19187.1 polysaccharide deacetylase [Falsochrobactrum shanghaiense]
MNYPRNLVGYGRNTPDPKWPGSANIAVQFVVNYEEGGESCILDGDPASECLLSEIVGAQAWQGQRNLNMESIYEYGARAGFWRLWRAFTRRNMPVTVYGVTLAMARNPEAVAAMKEADWEIASHGLRWLEYKDFPEEVEREHIREAVRLHTEITGSRPLGIYQGKPSDNTLKLVMEEGGFLYSADSYADELPYWVKGPKGPHLIVPYTLDANDMRFATPQGFNCGEQFFTYLKDAFDVLYREGDEGAPKMLSIGLHCRIVGRPGRMAALERFLDYVQSHDKVWVARRIDIARHWHEHHKPIAASVIPSKAGRAEFVARYGGIFEHSPWIAERAHDGGLSAGQDTASGLHAAMVHVFRSAKNDEKLGVLLAHPDLAGKLAQAKRLTAESTAEQASAGLDALTDEERQKFTALNEAYMQKFKFPFIIAVKGRSKQEILDAFERRLSNERDAEFATACAQVERIALLRLKDILPETL